MFGAKKEDGRQKWIAAMKMAKLVTVPYENCVQCCKNRTTFAA